MKTWGMTGNVNAAKGTLLQPSCGRQWIPFGSMVDAVLIYDKKGPLQRMNLSQNSVVLGDQLHPDM